MMMPPKIFDLTGDVAIVTEAICRMVGLVVINGVKVSFQTNRLKERLGMAVSQQSFSPPTEC